MKQVKQYEGNNAWQYDIRVKNLKEDMLNDGITEEEMLSLRTSDFTFANVTDKEEQRKMVAFIERHEWLGNISQYTTHWFSAYYKDKLAGVMLFNLPNAFSKMLGDNTDQLERLISRGACISWSPKNLASNFLMWCIKWMAKNTQYRLFTAYADPIAKELGTIYQACNFYYLGQNSGANRRYVNPYTGKIVSDRYFRQRTAYKKYAEELGIEWDRSWCTKTGMAWDNVPKDIEKSLKDMSKHKQATSKYIEVPRKHKYAYVLGATKKETTRLREEFLQRNKVRPYPKER